MRLARRSSGLRLRQRCWTENQPFGPSRSADTAAVVIHGGRGPTAFTTETCFRVCPQVFPFGRNNLDGVSRRQVTACHSRSKTLEISALRWERQGGTASELPLSDPCRSGIPVNKLVTFNFCENLARSEFDTSLVRRPRSTPIWNDTATSGRQRIG